MKKQASDSNKKRASSDSGKRRSTSDSKKGRSTSASGRGRATSGTDRRSSSSDPEKRRSSSDSSKRRSNSASGRGRATSSTDKRRSASDPEKRRPSSDSGKRRSTTDSDKRRSGSNSDKRRAPIRKAAPARRSGPGFTKAREKKAHEDLEKTVVRKSKDENIRLNKFIANSGICSRREADKLIESGIITVNGKPVTELGIQVSPSDDVRYDGQRIRLEQLRYVLLNKPKDYITTLADPKGRKTVSDLVKKACKERIYPIGRLDKATTGLLLFTNDGDLAKKLAHPKYNVQKIYHVHTLEKVKPADLKKLREGVQLDDGPIKADEIEFVGDGKDMRQVGVEIHSGRNRIVRRMFEHFGYTVKKLDRVIFAGLTKKDLGRGRFRHLTTKEVAFLKMQTKKTLQ